MRLFWNQGAELSFRPEGFFGREGELLSLKRICDIAKFKEGSCVLIYGPPNVGKTSLLLRLKEQLLNDKEFAPGSRLFPFYFSFSKAMANPFLLAHYFMLEYLWQLLAFVGDAPRGGFDAFELAERLISLGINVPTDHIRAVEKSIDKKDALTAIATALAFPFAFEKEGLSDIYLFDDFQYSMKVGELPEWVVLSILRPFIKGGLAPFIISGSTPGTVTSNLKKEGLFSSFTLMEIGSLDKEAAKEHLEFLLDRRKIELDEELLFLLVERLGGAPIYHRLFIDEMVYGGGQVSDRSDIENFYADSIVGGRLNRYWKEFFESCIPRRRELAKAVRFLKRVLVDGFPIDNIEGAIGMIGGEPSVGEEIIDSLEFKGLLKSDFEHLSFVKDRVLSDFLFWAYERAVIGKSNNQIASQIVQKNIFTQKYPRLEEYKAEITGAIKNLLREWDCQAVPSSLFDYPSFRERYGQRGALEVLIGVEGEKIKYRLPKMSSVSRGYMVGGRLPRVDFDIVAFGFINRDYSEDSMVIWAVDFISDKTVDRNAIEHFENRCRLLALEKSLLSDQLVKWLVFEGSISDDALSYAAKCGIFTTHGKQLKILFNIFDIESISSERRPPLYDEDRKTGSSESPLEFNLVIPMREDAEVVAAKVAEEVSHFKDVDRDTVDRVKMAIIEACINAFEHSGSESGMVKLRYVIADDKLEVFVSDEGSGISIPRSAGEKDVSDRPRGWGLKIIRGLVDDVDIVSGDRGTTVRMVKYFDIDGEEEGEAGGPTKNGEEGGDRGEKA